MNVLRSLLYREDVERVLYKLDFEKLANKKLLITGGLGLICSAVADLLVIANQKFKLNTCIYIAARSRPKFEERFGACENVIYVAYDATQEVHFDFHVDYIIHGASLASPEKYTTEPVETMLSNIRGINNLLVYAGQEKVERVLYISSSEVYGKKKTGEAFVEGAYGSVNIDSLRSSYAISKQAAELLCKAYSSEYGVDTVIARPGHVYGPTASSTDKRVSTDFAFKAANQCSLVLKSSGLQRRSYCYCVDVAAALLTILINGNRAESYNVGTRDVLTIKEMASIYAQAGNVSLEYVLPTEEELGAFNPMDNSSLNCDKLYSLGFQSSFSAREGMEHTVKILRECQVKGSK